MSVEEKKNLIPQTGKQLVNIAKKIMDTNSRLLQSHIRQEHLEGGTTDDRLRVRSGKLRASLQVIAAKETLDGKIEGGVSIGPSVYARVHIGPKNQVTKIIPKNKKYLTIPLPAAMTGAGVLRGSAGGSMVEGQGVFGHTFVAKSKKGNLIIFGKQRIMKGARAGHLRGKIVPLFLLKKQVEVKTRVFPEEQIAWILPKILEEFKKLKGVAPVT